MSLVKVLKVISKEVRWGLKNFLMNITSNSSVLRSINFLRYHPITTLNYYLDKDTNCQLPIRGGATYKKKWAASAAHDDTYYH